MLVLASASPRRQELLAQVGLTCRVEASDINEDRLPHESAADYVSRLAEEKARAVFERIRVRREPELVEAAAGEAERLVVLGADTCVLLDGKILGKPANRAQAREMLDALSGRTHQVLTGVAAVTRVRATVAVEISQVTFNRIPPHELQHYLESGEPLDKAGAYGIQGYAARWIPRIEGCYFNVVGLPLARTLEVLDHAHASLDEAGVASSKTNVLP